MYLRSLKYTLSVFAVVAACVCSTSFGGIIAQYDVYSTSANQSNPHGLWTSSDVFGQSGTGNNYYDIQAGTLFTRYDDGTATLIGTAVNQFNSLAEINLRFDDFVESVLNPATQYKKENGLAYDATQHDFYQTVSGSITMFSPAATSGVVVDIDTYAMDYSFQFGMGANAKSATELGGSAWIQEASSTNQMNAHHWDLNLRFEPRGDSDFIPSNNVPEPTSMLVWSALSLTLVSFRRRRQA